ncbi:MAG: NAD-dependent epimerase/dehydratase family protein [Deltaproteobacteria bacterium]|nr:NAD-dependent epimerase/dehydratase family protein [Deltaproteobacteria bacterium]MBW2122846.1 NAD-dependent epimerase/dehydratase family protein [Deltaproteobacteria bacterium]
MANPNNVIVTGGSGLLGSSLVHQLVEGGQEHPIVMDINPDPKRLKDIMDQIEYVRSDVADPEALASLIGRTKPTKIYHIAAYLGDACERNQMEAVRINVNGFMHLLETARQHNVSRVLFSSSATTYGEDLEEGEVLNDRTLQRPASFYGITKVFAENAGRYYRRRFGLDYRGIHYPAIIGPGERVGGIVSYTSAIIEHSARGESYTVPISPEIRLPLVYVEDGGRALIMLGNAPAENIKTVNYFINGVKDPVPTAGEMVEMVNRHIPGARITFDINPEWDKLLKSASHLVDDNSSVREWAWKPSYDTYDKIIDAYLQALKNE